jgi:hypothetical protein
MNFRATTDLIIDNKVDIIILDSDFIGEKYNTLKSNTKLLGVITKNELPYEIVNDFIIPMPFLPSTLEEIFKIQLNIIEERNNAKVYVKNIENNEIDEKELSENFLNELEDNLNINDESIININNSTNGGILDPNQLNEIEELLESKSTISDNDFIEISTSENDDNWQDLSSIVDQAINEANTLNTIVTAKNTIDIKLNDFQLEELTPLLNLLDQDIINQITKGDEIRLNLRFEEEND